MQIFEFRGAFEGLTLGNIFGLLPPYNLGFFVFVPAASAVLCLFLFCKTLPKKIPLLLLPTFIFIGAYINTYGLIDEVAVNLEHPFNFFHFGKFSMSPDRMTDGTVELLYYFLHVPFAATQKLLILGNFLIGLLVGGLHLVLLWKGWFRERSFRNLLILSAFALHVPVLEIFSSGFGNSLLSLAFLAAFYLYFQKKITAALVLSACFPLIRPDGWMASLAFLSILLWDGENRSKKNLGMAAAGPVGGVLLFMGIFHLLYGYATPTPILFKSIKLSMLPLFDASRFKKTLFIWIFNPWIIGLFLLILGNWIKILLQKIKIEREQKLYTAAFIVLSGTFFIIVFSHSITDVLRRDYTYSRYWTPLLLVLFLWSSRILASLDAWRERKTGNSKSYFVFALFFGFFLLSIGYQSWIKANHESGFINRAYAADVGSFADRILPGHFKFSTAEMNTFGLASRRNVTDLFGYSNRSIASSRVCSSEKVRTNPDYFLKEKPDIAWIYWFAFPKAYNFDTVEASFKIHALAYYHGDLRETLKAYDLFLIRDAQEPLILQAGFLVKKEAGVEFQKSLIEYGFSLSRQKEQDLSFLEKTYAEAHFYTC